MSINKEEATFLGGFDTGFIVPSGSNQDLPVPNEFMGAGLYAIRLKLQNNLEGIYLLSTENDEGRRVSMNMIINSNVFPATTITNQMNIASASSGMPSIRIFVNGADGTWEYVKTGGGNNPISLNFKKIKTVFA